MPRTVEWSSGKAPHSQAAGRGFEAPLEQIFLPNKKEGEVCCEPVTAWDRHGHVIDVGPASGTTPPHHEEGTYWWTCMATSSKWDPLVGPRCHIIDAGTRWWDRMSTSPRSGPTGGMLRHVIEVGPPWWDHGPTSSRWYTGQTFYDD
jgi:hypothetical protein